MEQRVIPRKFNFWTNLFFTLQEFSLYFLLNINILPFLLFQIIYSLNWNKILASLRADGTMRKEVKIRPGWKPLEEIPVYVIP